MRAGAKIVSVLGAGILLAGCSGSEGGSDATPSQSVGGAGVGGSTTAVVAGGATQTKGQSGLGGRSASVTSSNRGGTVAATQAKGGSSADGSDAEGGSATEGGTSSIVQTTTNGGTISSRDSTAKSGNPSKGGATTSSGSAVVGGTSSKGGSSSSKGGATTAVGGTSTTGGISSKGGTTTTGGSSPGSTSTSGGGDATPSTGCGKTATLKSGTITLGSRNYILKLPTNYDSSHPYRLILGLHGYGGSSTGTQSEKFFGLEPLSNGSTIFIAPNAVGGSWSASTDVTFVDDILKQVEADLCIDTSRILLEGFSQGAAMSWSIACTSKNVFRAVIGHSGGGVANPTSCKPVAYFGSLGLGESGNSQKTQTDQFAKWNGCTIETLPTAPKGSHVCTNYNGCPAPDPVRWCSYDGGHTSAPTDSGQSSSWMPKEVWAFVSQF